MIKAPTLLEVGAKDFPMRSHGEFGANDIRWIFSGPFRMIDNFAPVPVEYQGFHFGTTEHAFAAAKTLDLKYFMAIIEAPNPGVAKAIGRRAPLRSDWETIKYQVMLDVLRVKFKPAGVSRDRLMATGDRLIYEGNTWNDDVWGIIRSDHTGENWHGRNALGVLLMKVRQEINEGKL